MRVPLLILIAVAVLALVACSAGAAPAQPGVSPAAVTSPGASPEDPTPVAGGPDGSLQLDGRTFLGTKADPAAPGDVTGVRLTFRDGTLSASGGCNSMGGPYQVVDGILGTGQMAMTEMACEEPRMTMDTWLAALLPGAKLTLDDDTLTLVKDGTTLTLVDEEVARPDLPLAQRTQWALDGIAQGGADGAVSSVPVGVTAGITFGGDQANVAFGCNSGVGEVVIAESSLTFGPVGSTKMACDGPAGDVERVMQSVLSGEVAYTIDGDLLTITGADGTMLTFRGTQPG